MAKDFTTREEVAETYGRRATWYDITANLYYLIGFREQAYRRRAVDRLGLCPGETVVEIGYGTGLNFTLLQERVGPEDRIIGVDLSPAVLARSDHRVRRRGWSNTDLVRWSAADYRFPNRVAGILSTFALTLESDYDTVIANGAKAFAKGRRWAVLDLRMPENTLHHIAPLLVFLVRPFAVSVEVAARRPWDSIRTVCTTFPVKWSTSDSRTSPAARHEIAWRSRDDGPAALSRRPAPRRGEPSPAMTSKDQRKALANCDCPCRA